MNKSVLGQDTPFKKGGAAKDQRKDIIQVAQGEDDWDNGMQSEDSKLDADD